ncbi:MAG TPA: ArsA family ATPase [Gemmatimonadaceae bacterium]|nr:ArsA family ATPase [Gemmatimonadaceae bacterium]
MRTTKAADAGQALLEALPPISFVVGKGGVGKTTCAAALALRASRSGETLLVSTDPARALPSVLAHPVGADAAPIAYAPRLSARMLEAPALRETFMTEWRDVLATILDRGTYLDDADIRPLVDTALPGGDEIFSALELARYFSESREPTAGRLFIDTAPTGHTLRLLSLPRTFRALVRLLDAMQDKHRFMVRTLMRGYRPDVADDFLSEMQGHVDALESALRDPQRCCALLVTNAQPVVVAESERYLAALAALGIRVAGIVWNGEEQAAKLGVAPSFLVPRLGDPPVGEKGLELWMDSMRAAPRARTKRAGPRARPARQAQASGESPIAAEWLTPLTIVAGKGGVGKTTVACALGIVAASRYRTLVVSTDPAPSVADALGQPIPDADTAIEGVPRLCGRQMDATAAFDRLRNEYSARVDALFDNLLGSGVNLDRDHAIARDLLALAPPGVDEVYALTLLSDALFAGTHERVIVDPAPTGHLLRLLEMPRLALDWTHQLMRLMLRYKDVAGLGDTARDLLEFAKNLRSLDVLLRDPARCGMVLVTLEEPVVRAESERLAAAAAERGVAVRAVVHNRGTSSSLPVGAAGVQVVAPAEQEPLVGADAIRRWTSRWIAADPLPGRSPRTIR